MNCQKSFARLFSVLLLISSIVQPYRFANAQKPTTPLSSPGLQFVSGHSALIPFERVGNFIYLRARVNDSEPLWFLLDTGATASYLSAERAKELGLEAKSVTLSMPGVKVIDQHFSPLPLRLGAYSGHAADGLLGYDFISRFAIEIDYLKNTVRLNEPTSYRYFGSGEIVPLTLLEDDSGGKVPLVNVKVQQAGRVAIEGKFIADTAVRSAVSFNTPFVNTHKLLQPAPHTIRVPLGGGAMVRESTQAIGRLQSIELGKLILTKPIAVFFQDKQGVVASTEFNGVIGAEILRRFKVIFNYSRQQMILEPNRYLHEVEEYDMSGMLLIADEADFKTLKIRRIVENSPAVLAGFQEGDILSTIGGKAASRLTLEQVRKMFKQPGRSYRLVVERNGKQLHSTIKLRRLI